MVLSFLGHKGVSRDQVPFCDPIDGFDCRCVPAPEWEEVVKSLVPFPLTRDFDYRVLPKTCGVYFVVLERTPRELLYIGKTTLGFHERYKKHHRMEQFLEISDRGDPVVLYCLPIPFKNAQQLWGLEVNLVKDCKPSLNGTPVPKSDFETCGDGRQ